MQERKTNSQIIISGPPTLLAKEIASFLHKTYGYEVAIVSDLIRSEIQCKTHMGIKLNSILQAGELIPNLYLNELISNAKSQLKTVYIGYPRTPEQFDLLYEATHIPLKEFIVFRVNESDPLIDYLADKCDILDLRDGNDPIHRIKQYFHE